jgi:hypothetical protein
MDWIHLARDRDKWQALENAVQIFRFYKHNGFLDQLTN